MFILFYIKRDRRTGSDLVVRAMAASSKDDALRAFATAESVPAAGVGVIDATVVTPSAKAVVSRRGARWRRFFSCLWMAHKRRDENDLWWPHIFEVATADEAARNLYLHQGCMENDSVEQVRREYQSSGYTLADITAKSLVAYFEERLAMSRSGADDNYDVGLTIIDVNDLGLRGRSVVQGARGSRMEEVKEHWEWLRELSKSGHSPEEILQLLLELPPEQRTWFGEEHPPEDLQKLCRKLGHAAKRMIDDRSY
jgi:hypothetical protein